MKLVEVVRDDSLEFANQRVSVICSKLLRGQVAPWKDIRKRICRIDGEPPSMQMLWTAYVGERMS